MPKQLILLSSGQDSDIPVLECSHSKVSILFSLSCYVSEGLRKVEMLVLEDDLSAF